MIDIAHLYLHIVYYWIIIEDKNLKYLNDKQI